MRSQWRWGVVAAGTAALLLLPWTIARIPHSRSAIGVDATIVDPGRMHLPRPSDLTPPELARRFLAHGSPSAATRLGTRRIAGHDAAGIRLVPREPESTIRAVDVWADPATGLPLQVQALAKGGLNRPIESRFLEVRL